MFEGSPSPPNGAYATSAARLSGSATSERGPPRPRGSWSRCHARGTPCSPPAIVRAGIRRERPHVVGIPCRAHARNRVAVDPRVDPSRPGARAGMRRIDVRCDVVPRDRLAAVDRLALRGRDPPRNVVAASCRAGAVSELPALLLRESRSLCRRWLYMGTLSTNQSMPETPGRGDCAECWRRRRREIDKT